MTYSLDSGRDFGDENELSRTQVGRNDTIEGVTAVVISVMGVVSDAGGQERPSEGVFHGRVPASFHHPLSLLRHILGNTTTQWDIFMDNLLVRIHFGIS